MTEPTPAPDVAVQIIEQAMVGVSATRSRAETVVAALRAVGYLTPPTEVAALRAVADIVRRFVVAADTRSMAKPTSAYVEEFRAALDALPPAEQPAPAPPQGEDVDCPDVSGGGVPYLPATPPCEPLAAAAGSSRGARQA